MEEALEREGRGRGKTVSKSSLVHRPLHLVEANLLSWASQLYSRWFAWRVSTGSRALDIGFVGEICS